jgi:hypothetical protein
MVRLHRKGAKVPLKLQRTEVLKPEGGMLRLCATMAYSAVELKIDDVMAINDIPQVFHPCLAIYREAINSCNPYYRLLCLCRIGERLIEIQRDNMKRLKNESGFKRSRITIPENELTKLFFGQYVGKNLNHFLDKHVKPEYRNNIAHFSLEKGSFDANGKMLLPPADNKINTIAEATNTVLIDVINMAIREEIEIMKKYKIT